LRYPLFYKLSDDGAFRMKIPKQSGHSALLPCIQLKYLFDENHQENCLSQALTPQAAAGLTPISLMSMQDCIMAAYHYYLSGQEGTFPVHTTDNGVVNITCVINRAASLFNCGVPGYCLDAAQGVALRHWCTNHPGPDAQSRLSWSFGFRGQDERHPNAVNITLIDRTPLMFNFHVNYC